MRKGLTHAAFGILTVIIGLVAYWVSDRQPPSYYIASWVMTRDIYRGGPISIRFILVRHRLCTKRIEQRIDQGGSNFLLPSRMIEMADLGLDVLTLPEKVPDGLELGDATYSATFIWRCPGNFVHFFMPVTMEVNIPIEVKE